MSLTAPGEVICHLTTAVSENRITLRAGVNGSIVFRCDELGLSPGLYLVDTAIIWRGHALGSAIDWDRVARCIG